MRREHVVLNAWILFTFAAMTAACAGDKVPATGETDQDGDGWPEPEDCDDTNASVWPGADEVCDEQDQDCDGEVDEGSLYLDSDGDGYGDAEVSWALCEAPDGAVSNSEDCDDTDAEANPGATETWYDGGDADCDGADDYDADADGEPSDHYGGEDCDDQDASKTDEAFDTLAIGAGPDCGTIEVFARLVGADEEDGVGWLMDGGGDVNGDGVDDMAASSRKIPTTDEDAGYTYVVQGPVLTETILSTAVARLHDADAIWIGGVVGPHDLDGDGYGDVAHVTVSLDLSPTLRLFAGPLVGDYENEDAAQSWHLDGVFGSFMAEAGDVDGDGTLDMLINTCSVEDTDRCGAALLSGPLMGEVPESPITAFLTDSYGPFYSCESGVDGGFDVNADGLSDVGISCESWGVGVFEGPLSGTHEVLDADTLLSMTGKDVVGAGDTNGDGYDDLLVWQWDPTGREQEIRGEVSLVRGPLTGGEIAEVADARWIGSEYGVCIQIPVGPIDLDGDGFTEIALRYSPDPVGRFYQEVIGTMPGDSEGTYDERDVDWGIQNSGESSDWIFGVSVVGDLNNDGLDDLAIGSSYASVYRQRDGVIWLLGGGVLQQ